MKKRNIISLSGDLASGKGEVSKILMKKLNFGVYRNGEYFRKLAKEMNMTLADFGEYVESHPEIDMEIENSAKEYALDNDDFVIDARLGWYAVPESFKVYLKVDIDEAAKRAFNDEKRKNRVSKNYYMYDSVIVNRNITSNKCNKINIIHSRIFNCWL